MSSQHVTKLPLVFYGDDFTGSTDALEVLTAAGLKCALFLDPPTPELLAELGGFDAIGIAGDSRALSNAEMDVALPEIFEGIKRLSPALIHYKVCSTFDSADSVGSIGHVIELASRIYGVKGVPIIAGNPALGRYCVFGNLYALSKTDHKVHRIDRHPIMRAHPITPMHEADLSIHIGKQKNLSIGKVDISQLARSAELSGLVNELSQQHDAVLFDGSDDSHMITAGQVLTELSSGAAPVFVVGSSGVEYGLTQYWRTAGVFPPRASLATPLKPVDQVLVISGSASPLSQAQIEAAIDYGFVELEVDAAALITESRKSAAIRDVVMAAVSHLEEGRSVLIHTAKGPGDSRIEQMIEAMLQKGLPRDEARVQGGKQLAMEVGQVALEILKAFPLKRLVVSGGDTSSQVTKVLAPDALVIKSDISPGAPLCEMRSREPYLKDVEIALKGGQMGNRDYFVKALRGLE
ncbi:four-carbon acid sugar kinase family protein [Pseudomonas sp. SWRI107]|uniref:four-carbon acid sugar kinase family protein n=1 Tax=Pseudomonas farsensis TaxID=2745492 RepID=UPI00164432F8|nr:four-carbon acid sugar kinase family protein [Pseudomonas farsensis]MBV4534016.1 four-carbon acid sugar kinase family protein [Pseudomonas farsensis]